MTKVADGGEPTEFKNLFHSWPVPQASGKAYVVGGKIGMWEGKLSLCIMSISATYITCDSIPV